MESQPIHKLLNVPPMIASNKKTYWRSLADLQDTEEFRQFVEREFPVAASEFPEGVSRRRWMQLMGASLALGGLTGCRWEAEKIAPFAMRPENRIPGKPEYFATSIEIGGMPRHLLVTSYDGRPIKVEGNPDHPASQGATDVYSQAAILGLYDPDRSDALIQRDSRQQFVRTWQEFENFAKLHFEGLQSSGGKGLALLLQPSSSRSQDVMLKRFQSRFPQASVYGYSAISRENALKGGELAFGKRLRQRLHLEKANVIACFDDDPLGIHPQSIENAIGFAKRRDPERGMNRLFVVESQFSITGAAADHRLPKASRDVKSLLVQLDALVRKKLALPHDVELSSLTESEQAFLTALADDLVKQRGGSLVTVGSLQSPEVHALALDLNSTLGNIGVTMDSDPRSCCHDAPAVAGRPGSGCPGSAGRNPSDPGRQSGLRRPRRLEVSASTETSTHFDPLGRLSG